MGLSSTMRPVWAGKPMTRLALAALAIAAAWWFVDAWKTLRTDRRNEGLDSYDVYVPMAAWPEGSWMGVLPNPAPVWRESLPSGWRCAGCGSVVPFGVTHGCSFYPTTTTGTGPTITITGGPIQ